MTKDPKKQPPPDPLSPAEALKRATELEAQAAPLPYGYAKLALLDQAKGWRELAASEGLTPPKT